MPLLHTGKDSGTLQSVGMKWCVPMRQVSLSFYEKRKKQSGWAIIGGALEERLYWEQWCAPLISVTASKCSSLVPQCTSHAYSSH